MDNKYLPFLILFLSWFILAFNVNDDSYLNLKILLKINGKYTFIKTDY